MNGDSDFDHAINTFHDFFVEDSTDDVHQIFDQFSNQYQEIVAGKHSTIKVMKNDIRRYYSRMFMNTVNSGDFNQLQGFFSTFMTGPAKFIVNHDDFDSKYNLPPILAAEGPKLAVHFHLGMFVMYPDTVIYMTNTQITTSNTWAGTKIEISVDVLATKIYDLADEEWMPQLCTLEEKCSQLAEEKRKKAEAESDSATEGSSIPDRSTTTTSTSSTAPTDRTAPNNTPTSQSTAKRGDSNKNGKTVRKRRRPSRPNAAETSTDDTAASGAQPTGKEDNKNSQFISEEYVQMLCARATLLPKPIQSYMQGVVTILLDENNHIQHMNIRTRPKDEPRVDTVG